MKYLGYAQKLGDNFYNIELDKGYGVNEISNCPDPDGGNRTEMPTAIPSPFARFDLVKTAFKNITNSPSLKADSGGKRASKHDEKLVSHTLDLAEIVFNYRTYAGKVEILKWNKGGSKGGNEIDEKSSLYALEKKQPDFADALKLYMKLDAKAYNFDQLENIFLFKSGQQQDSIIGSTSPITLFCPSAARFDGLGLVRQKDKKPYFCDDYMPLYERSENFQEWFYSLLGYLKLKCKGADLSDIREYARKSLDNLDHVKDEELIGKLTKSYDPDTESESKFESTYVELHVGGETNAPVDILGVNVRVVGSEIVDGILNNSDFVIVPTKKVDGSKNLPLALQSRFARTGFKYGEGEWIPGTIVPSYVEGSWTKKRDMPGIGGATGNYVTVSDFLEPYLVKTIYPISKNFLAFDKMDNSEYGYLYPLKEDFFNFFSIKSLNAIGPKNPKISLAFQNDGSVKVTLDVPIKKTGQKVTFERIYKNSEELPDESKIDGGVIVTKRFGITVFPFVKGNIKEIYGVDPDYRVQFIDYDCSDLVFQAESQIVGLVDSVKDIKGTLKKNTRSDKTRGTPASSRYYEIKEEFDFIRVKMVGNVVALVIPQWKEAVYSGKKYTFAVDFGTTNTHIAYMVGSDPVKSFDITGIGNDVQIASLFDETSVKTNDGLENENALEIKDLIDKEFVPRVIGNSGGYVFPLRTALAYNEDIPTNWPQIGLNPLFESNIPFCYEKLQLTGYKIETNLKWNAAGDPNKYRINAYFRQIMMLLQNKVLVTGGSLKETRLIWFYPSSMSENDIGGLEEKWKDNFKRYFVDKRIIEEHRDKDAEERVKGRLESLAPYYAQGEAAFSGANVLSVDIGGGTTDVAVFCNGKLKGTTSFRFAGNALFGDAYSLNGQGADKNGFVIRFKSMFDELLGNEFIVGRGVLDDVLAKKKAEDINAFFFSVEGNIGFWTELLGMVAVDKEPYSYSVMIRNMGHDLMFLVLYFYVALIYHVGQVLKNMKDDQVKLNFVIFSGTASKILKILTKRNNILTKLTVEVFEHFGLADNDLEIILTNEPKEATCKGGLNMKDTDQQGKVKPFVYSCVKEGFESATYNEYLEDAKKEEKSEIGKSLVEFHKFFFSLDDPARVEFHEFFGIESMVTRYVKGQYEKLIKKWVKSAVMADQEGVTQKDNIATETPFFIPLKAIIQDLSFAIANREYRK